MKIIITTRMWLKLLTLTFIFSLYMISCAGLFASEDPFPSISSNSQSGNDYPNPPDPTDLGRLTPPQDPEPPYIVPLYKDMASSQIACLVFDKEGLAHFIVTDTKGAELADFTFPKLLKEESLRPDVAFADLDGDSDAEILVLKTEGDNLSVIYIFNPTDGSTREVDTYALDKAAHKGITAADCNGDGYQDIILGASGNAEKPVISVIDVHDPARPKLLGIWTFVPTGKVMKKSIEIFPMICDADGDSLKDLVVVLPDGSGIKILISGIKGNADWPVYQHDAKHSAAYGEKKIPKPRVSDADKIAFGENTVEYKPSSADETIEEVVPANLDGDAKSDFVMLIRASDGKKLVRTYYSNSETSILDEPLRVCAGPLVCDLDKDGKDEVVVRTDKDIRAYKGKGGLFKEKGWPLPIEEGNARLFPLAIADLDGDGYDEVISSKDVSKVVVIKKDTVDSSWKILSFDADCMVRIFTIGKLEKGDKPTLIYATDPHLDPTGAPVASQLGALRLEKDKDGNDIVTREWSAYIARGSPTQ